MGPESLRCVDDALDSNARRRAARLASSSWRCVCICICLFEYLAAEKLNGEGSGVIDFATSDDYSFPGVIEIHYRTVNIGAKRRARAASGRLTACTNRWHPVGCHQSGAETILAPR